MSGAFNLGDEISKSSFKRKNSVQYVTKYANHFNDFIWVTVAAYVADTVSALYELNMDLQGRASKINQVEGKIEIMLKSLKFEQIPQSKKIVITFLLYQHFSNYLRKECCQLK